MKIFLDFDDVIFDTKQFNIDRIKIFKKYGVSEEVFNQYFENFKTNRKKGELITYSQEEHIENLRNILNDVDFEGLKKELSEFIKGAKKYVFKEFYDFAEKIGKENLYLISYGDIKYQTEKIKNSEVGGYLNDVIITDGLKSEALIERFKNNKGEVAITEKVYFIDDRAAQLEDVKKKIPKIHTLLMASERGRHHKEEMEDKARISKYCDGVIGDFTEIEELMEQNGELE